MFRRITQQSKIRFLGNQVQMPDGPGDFLQDETLRLMDNSIVFDQDENVIYLKETS